MNCEEAKTQHRQARADKMENREKAQMIRIRFPLVTNQWGKLSHSYLA